MTSEFDENWNEELAGETSAQGVDELVVYSRDWTVETVLTQIAQGNIDLNPKFQRRNAWNDAKRSKLVESLIMGLPVPEIVLAEDKDKRRAFIVIDGKQRLLALAGFADPSMWNSWDRAKLKGITSRPDLLNKAFADLEREPNDFRQLMNADVRCTVISNYRSNDTLYDIFYRLNTGSVSLSSQELRQVLNRGPFADFLIERTNQPLPLHTVMNLSGPDDRLRDAEIVLRYIAFSMFGPRYGGNLAPFLDDCMAIINGKWQHFEERVNDTLNEMQFGTGRLLVALGDKVGRKVTNAKWESRFNRALYEVQAYYFARIPDLSFEATNQGTIIKDAFALFCSSSAAFLDSIESTTKNVEKTRTRFSLFQGFVNEVFDTHIDAIPLEP